jgi:hypothetical protein
MLAKEDPYYNKKPVKFQGLRTFLGVITLGLIIVPITALVGLAAYLILAAFSGL